MSYSGSFADISEYFWEVVESPEEPANVNLGVRPVAVISDPSSQQPTLDLPNRGMTWRDTIAWLQTFESTSSTSFRISFCHVILHFTFHFVTLFWSSTLKLSSQWNTAELSEEPAVFSFNMVCCFKPKMCWYFICLCVSCRWSLYCCVDCIRRLSIAYHSSSRRGPMWDTVAAARSTCALEICCASCARV